LEQNGYYAYTYYGYMGFRAESIVDWIPLRLQ